MADQVTSSEFRPTTDALLGDPDFQPTDPRDEAFRGGYDLLLAAPDSLTRRWAKYVDRRRIEESDVLIDCHEDSVDIALASLNQKAAWGSVYPGSTYRTAREQLAASIKHEYATATPELRAELDRAQHNPRRWADSRLRGRGRAIPTPARGLRCAQLQHLTHRDQSPVPGLHTHVLVAPEVVAADADHYVTAQPGQLYELELVTFSHVALSFFSIYTDVVEALTEERLGVRLEPDEPLPPADPYDPRGRPRSKVDCPPYLGMRQLDRESADRWPLTVSAPH
jgi:hypothetical protein